MLDSFEKAGEVTQHVSSQMYRSIQGISNKQQWDERITMAEVREQWGNEELVDKKIQKRRLE